VFGDMANGRVSVVDVASLADGRQPLFFELPLQHRGRDQSLREIVRSDRADLRFGQDDAGELYVLSKRDGMVRRIARSTASETAIRAVESAIER
jgi:hypothetical protein